MTMHRSHRDAKEEELGVRIDTFHTQCDCHRLKSVQDETSTKRCSPRWRLCFLTKFVQVQAPKQCSQTVAEQDMRKELPSLAVVSLKQLESGAVALQFSPTHFSTSLSSHFQTTNASRGWKRERGKEKGKCNPGLPLRGKTTVFLQRSTQLLAVEVHHQNYTESRVKYAGRTLV